MKLSERQRQHLIRVAASAKHSMACDGGFSFVGLAAAEAAVYAICGELAAMVDVEVVGQFEVRWGVVQTAHFLVKGTPIMRVVITKEGDKFVGQLLDHDICSQGATIDQLMDRLGLTIDLEKDARGGSLADIGPAPNKLHPFEAP